jgi:DUF4097 and DUF4098 domain-containing protein YvlB
MSQEASMQQTFHTPAPVRLRVELWDGELTVTAEHTDTTTVVLEPEGDAAQELINSATVEQRGDEIVVLLPKARAGLFRRGLGVNADIHVPFNSAAHIKSASADVDLLGALGDVHVSTGSGDVRVDHAGDLTIRTGSGDVTVNSVAGRCDARSGSADLAIGTVAGDGDVISGSGDVEIDTIAGRLAIKSGSGDVIVRSGGDAVDAMTGSGDVELRRIDHGKVKAKTGSGDIAIGVARGTAAYLNILTVSGDVHSELDGAQAPVDGDQTAEINVMSGSGDVILQRA